jgi:hypothetical protein
MSLEGLECREEVMKPSANCLCALRTAFHEIKYCEGFH